MQASMQSRPHKHPDRVFWGTNGRDAEVEPETDDQPAGGVSLGQEGEELG